MKQKLSKILMTLAALFMATAGAWAQSADTINAAPVPNQPNKWSFRMPAGDVEVLVKYKTPTTLSLTYYGQEINTEDPVGMALTANFNGEAAFKQSLAATVTANNEAVANLPVTYTSNNTEVIAFGDNHAASGALADIRFLSKDIATLTAQFAGNDSLASSNAVSVPVQIIGPADTYTVALADNTEDAGNWQAKADNDDFQGFPLEGVTASQTVTVKYEGSREVSRIEVVEEATPADEVTLATPLTLEALTAGTIKVNQPKSGMQYSLNGGTKTAVTTDAINVAAGDKVAFFGTGTNITSYDSTSIAGGTAEVKAYGNIMSLVDEENFATAITLTASNAFSSLFKDNGKLTDASDLLLPAETLASSCYNSMFYGCTSLTAAPELPATTLAMSCYSSMFNSCTSLTAAPALPATTLAMSCYLSMFRNCTSLTAAPQLPASTLASSCYNSMFYGCTSLTAAPELPATTLAPSCYLKMFHSCTNLNTAPALPATTLAQNCYAEMFYSCQALTAAPELPATTLTYGCYSYMFGSCTSLTSAPVLPATTLTGYCYQSMFNGCSKLSSVTCRATNISADQCLNSWLSNAGTQASSPKLYVDPSMTNADWHNGNFFTVTAIP